MDRAVREGVGGVLVMTVEDLRLLGRSGWRGVDPGSMTPRAKAEALCLVLWPEGKLEIVQGRGPCSSVVLRGVAGEPGWSVVVLPGEDGWEVAARELEQRARDWVLNLRASVSRLERSLAGLGIVV